MNIDGALEFLLTEREVGILSDLQLRHLLARGRNPKEKPIERLFKDISDWERNSFKEYCGRNAAERPEAWRKLYAQHQQFVKGQLSASPFIDYQRLSREPGAIHHAPQHDPSRKALAEIRTACAPG